MLYGEDVSVLGALVAGSMVKFAWLYYMSLKSARAKDTVKVGKIGKLFLFPIKSCKPIQVDEAECTPLGLKVGPIVDRNRVIVDKDGYFVTMGDVSKMCLIKPSVTGDSLLLQAEGMPTLTLPIEPPLSAPCVDAKPKRHLPDSLPARDYGAEAALWLEKFLGLEGCRLVYAAPDLDKRIMGECEKRFFDLARADEEIAFPDIATYLVMAQSSLDDLAAKLPADINVKVTEANFRGNIVVNDSEPFSEDNWHTMYIGDQACLYKMKLCQRCPKTTIDPSDAKRIEGGEPMKTLRTYRLKETYLFKQSPIMGIHSNLLRSGKICVGDDVYASFDSPVGYLM